MIPKSDLPATSIIYSDLQFKNEEGNTPSASANEVSTAFYNDQLIFFKLINDTTYRQKLAEAEVMSSGDARIFAGKKAANTVLVYKKVEDEDLYKLVGVASYGIPGFKPIRDTTYSIEELVYHEYMISLFVNYYLENDDLHIYNLGINGYFIDFDMFRYPITKEEEYKNGVRVLCKIKSYVVQAQTDGQFPLSAELIKKFPNIDYKQSKKRQTSPCYWPTFDYPENWNVAKAYANPETFRALSTSNAAKIQRFRVILRCLVVTPEMHRAVYEERVKDQEQIDRFVKHEKERREKLRAVLFDDPALFREFRKYLEDPDNSSNKEDACATCLQWFAEYNQDIAGSDAAKLDLKLIKQNFYALRRDCYAAAIIETLELYHSDFVRRITPFIDDDGKNAFDLSVSQFFDAGNLHNRFDTLSKRTISAPTVSQKSKHEELVSEREQIKFNLKQLVETMTKHCNKIGVLLRQYYELPAIESHYQNMVPKIEECYRQLTTLRTLLVIQMLNAKERLKGRSYKKEAIRNFIVILDKHVFTDLKHMIYKITPATININHQPQLPPVIPELVTQSNTDNKKESPPVPLITDSIFVGTVMTDNAAHLQASAIKPVRHALAEAIYVWLNQSANLKILAKLVSTAYNQDYYSYFRRFMQREDTLSAQLEIDVQNNACLDAIEHLLVFTNEGGWESTSLNYYIFARIAQAVLADYNALRTQNVVLSTCYPDLYAHYAGTKISLETLFESKPLYTELEKVCYRLGGIYNPLNLDDFEVIKSAKTPAQHNQTK